MISWADKYEIYEKLHKSTIIDMQVVKKKKVYYKRYIVSDGRPMFDTYSYGWKKSYDLEHWFHIFDLRITRVLERNRMKSDAALIGNHAAFCQ